METVPITAENNPSVAHALAHFINYLITKNIITAQDVSNADPSCFDELIIRYYKNIEANTYRQLTDHQVAQVKTIFHSKTIEPLLERDKQGESIVEIMRTVLDKYQEMHPSSVEGIILYGSRMYPFKKAREEGDDISDIDFIPILQKPFGMQEAGTAKRQFDKVYNESFPLSKIPLGMRSSLTSEELGRYLLGQTSPNFLPFWAWNKEGRFIGSLTVTQEDGSTKILDEAEVNAMMQDYLNSPGRAAQKEQMLAELKQKLLPK